MSSELEIRSPIDDTVVGSIPALTVSDVGDAYQAAAAAQREWSATDTNARTALLGKLSASLREHCEELAGLLTQEVGKTPEEAASEITRSADLIDATAAEYQALADMTIRSEDFPGTPAGRVQRVRRVPIGVVLAIAPFNYPINLSVSKIAPALAMGNAVVFKPPTQGSVVARRMVELWADAVPANLVRVVTGKTADIGDRLVTDDAVGMVALTGSTAVGQRIAKQVGMVPLLLELGGNDPALVLDDADVALAAQHIVGGAFKYAGQRCTAVKRVYVAGALADDLTAAIAAETAKRFGSSGDPREHPVGPVISDEQASYLDELLDDAKAKGGKVVAGGSRDGRNWDATVVSGLTHGARLVTEEQFGPLLPIVSVSDDDEAVRLANDTHYGLQASVFSADPMRAERVAERIEAGGVHLNGPDQRGPDNFMFTGYKHSGMGVQGVRFALDAMSKPQGIVRNDA